MSQSVFWRDPALPFVELRQVEDGRSLCYAPHSHLEWSMGAITRGESTFVLTDREHQVEAGTLVFINPDRMHVCNPVEGRPWAYLMLYLDAGWLAAQRFRLGLSASPDWHDLAPDVMRAPEVFNAFVGLAASLFDPGLPAAAKADALLDFLALLLPRLSTAEAPDVPANLEALADYLGGDHAAEDMSLEAMSRRAGVSPGHLIRRFKQHFGMTPHAYVINRRVQRGQRALRQGWAIVDAALDSGFADQPHFQRMFKRLLALTPRQYRRSSGPQQKDAAPGEQGRQAPVEPA